mmetsp:Transcript_11208/g.21356  ORF Transcript_11208/g.21356 Transcript_11208/m.21356 type:complete len:246 (-) Transcript_11208:184-921(-)
MATSGVALALATGAASDVLQTGEQDDGKRSLATRAAQGVAGASVVVNIIALALNFSGVMFVAAAIAAAIGAIVIMQQFVLEDTGSMTAVQNKLRKNVNELQRQNNRYAAENTRLEGQVSELKVQEGRLEQITAEQGTNVQRLVSLVKDNKEINAQAKVAVRAETLQLLLNTVLRVDRDGNLQFTDREIDELMLRFKDYPGVRVNHDNLKRRMQQKQFSVSGVFEFVKELEDEDKVEEDERVFTLV